MNRRDFLKIAGAVPIAAAVPMMAFDEAVAELPNVATITLRNLVEGSWVGIFEAVTMEKIFSGTATGSEIVASYHCEEPTEILCVVRSHGMESMRFQAYADPKHSEVTYNITQIEDRIHS